MTTSIVPAGESGVFDVPRAVQRYLRRRVLAVLQEVRFGRVVLIENGFTELSVASDAGGAPSVTVEVTDARFYTQLALGGTVGAGEAYIKGWWHCNRPTELVQILLRNRELLDGMETGLARLALPAYKLFHHLHRNSRGRARANIAAHYDLGDDLYELFLDRHMMYSCALFEGPNMDLDTASTAKLERICRKLDLQPDERVLEIGSGWGGFAIYAADRFGCRVTTTTISQRQYDFTRARVLSRGLSDRVTVLKEDYRDLQGTFDKLVSIEMIEAVGHAYYQSFFRQCDRLLAPDGMMLLQGITIEDSRYEMARRSVDFIQRYVFPGSCIPSVTALCTAAAHASDLRLFNLEDIGPHYATTLRHWRERFMARLDDVRALGYDERFIRLWVFYLCYCEGGFLERSIGNAQMLLVKPGCRRAPILPPIESRANVGG